MIKIKCVFPGNSYLLRKVRIKSGNKLIGKATPLEITELPKVKGLIKLRLDYHSAKIVIPDTDEDLFMIVYFGFRNYFPFYFTDLMFKNSLRVKLVDKNEFEEFDASFYGTPPSEIINFNWQKIYTIIVGIFLSCLFIVSPYLAQNQDDKDIGNFAFYIGLATIISFLQIIFNRKKITTRQYKTRILAFSFLSILLLIYLNIPFKIKTLAIVLPLNMALLAMKKEWNKIINDL